MKTATAFLVAVTVFTSLFLESSAAPNLLGRLTTNLADIVTQAGQSVGVVLDTADNTASGAVLSTGKVVNGIVNGVETLLNDVAEVISKTVKNIKSLLEELLGSLGPIKGELGEKLKIAMTKVKRAWEETTEHAKNTLKATAEDTNDTVEKFDGLLKNSLEELETKLAAVTDIVKQILEKAGDSASVFVNKVNAVVAKVREGAKNIVSDVHSAVKSKTTKVVDGSDQLRLPERIASSKKAVDELIEALNKAKVDDKGDYKDGLNQADKWATEELAPLVAETHSQLEKVVYGTPEQKKAMASKVRKIVEQVKEKIESLNIPDNVKKIINELMKTLFDNATTVADILEA